MGLPQILMLLLLGMGTGLHIAKNGEPRSGAYSAGAAIISDAIIVGLLWWGGFFS